MKLIAPATVEPVTVTELARNLRLFTGDGDYVGGEAGELQALIRAARADAEYYTGRVFAEQTVALNFRDFAGVMPLHRDLNSVVAVRYYDAANEPQLFTPGTYFAAVDSLMFFNGEFPTVYPRSDAVQVEFTVGGGIVCQTVKQAIILIASHWYENREASSPLQIRDVPLSYQWLLDSHRVVSIA